MINSSVLKPAYKLLLFFALVALLCGCNDYVSWSQKRWYENAKSNIFKQTRLQADSVLITYSRDSTERHEKSYSNGKIFMQQHYRFNTMRFEAYYAQTNTFELRREFCEDGTTAFEGIFVDDKAYGISTWWNCDKRLRKQGIRYKNEPVGEWLSREEESSGTVITDYSHLGLAMSMPEFIE